MIDIDYIRMERFKDLARKSIRLSIFYISKGLQDESIRSQNIAAKSLRYYNMLKVTNEISQRFWP